MKMNSQVMVITTMIIIAFALSIMSLMISYFCAILCIKGNMLEIQTCFGCSGLFIFIIILTHLLTYSTMVQHFDIFEEQEAINEHFSEKEINDPSTVPSIIFTLMIIVIFLIHSTYKNLKFCKRILRNFMEKQ